MIDGYGAVTQTLLGTLFTWGMTALGAALVMLIRGHQRKFLDGSLGFAAGIMTAASYWSLLHPAIEMCKESHAYGSEGQYAFVPVALGFLMGAVFVYGTDIFLDYIGINTTEMMLEMSKGGSKDKREEQELSAALNRDADAWSRHSGPTSIVTVDGNHELTGFSDGVNNQHGDGAPRRRNVQNHKPNTEVDTIKIDEMELKRREQWKRVMLLVIAITVHNIPEGMAVGVAFGAAANSPKASFTSARSLAIGIGIQNFPEGLAVSLPLKTAGFSMWRSFWYGQLSGMVEPVFGILGAVAVGAAKPVLPYALSFAAGAMIYVVADDILPEANSSGNGKLATWGCIIGFIVMMCLDVGLG